MAGPTLTLAQSPESTIAKAFYELVKADAVIAAGFSPIIIVESPTREALRNFGVYTLAVLAFSVKPAEQPSRRETSSVGVVLCAYLPLEETAEDSKLIGLDLGNHFRKLVYVNSQLRHPTTSQPITFATAEFTQLPILAVLDKGTRILSYRIVFETDIHPQTGEFQ